MLQVQHPVHTSTKERTPRPQVVLATVCVAALHMSTLTVFPGCTTPEFWLQIHSMSALEIVENLWKLGLPVSSVPNLLGFRCNVSGSCHNHLVLPVCVLKSWHPVGIRVCFLEQNMNPPWITTGLSAEPFPKKWAMEPQASFEQSSKRERAGPVCWPTNCGRKATGTQIFCFSWTNLLAVIYLAIFFFNMLSYQQQIFLDTCTPLLFAHRSEN